MLSMTLSHWKKEEGHWVFSSYKVNVMSILSESCSPGLWKNENIFMVCLQTAELKRETGRQLHTKGAATGEGIPGSDAHHLRVHFSSCFKVTPFQIPAGKRIFMNVEVLQNKARRKNLPKLPSRANETACKGSECSREIHRKCIQSRDRARPHAPSTFIRHKVY